MARKSFRERNAEYSASAAANKKPFSMTAKSAGVELIKILESIPEADRIDALAVAVKVYTEDSEATRRCRQAVREME